MADLVQQLKRINAFLDGQILLGNIESIDVGEVALATEEYIPNVDMPIDIEQGMEKIDVELKLKGFHAVAARQVGKGTPDTRLEVFGAIQNYDGTEKQIKYNFVGLATSYQTDALEGRVTMPMTTVRINCNFYEHWIDGQSQQKLDALNDIREINGVDVLARMRALIQA